VEQLVLEGDGFLLINGCVQPEVFALIWIIASPIAT
jgi:hypothetical protein